MRKIYLAFTFFACIVLFLSNSSDTRSGTNLFLLGGESDPILPEVPYDYAGISIPEHLRQPSYTDGGVKDTTIFDDLSNDAATLGRVLFYDELLSANENLSCATCHQQHLSFADETPFSAGASEDTKRNSLHLNDLGWTNNTAFFWDLSHGNLKEMIALPLENPNEIGVTDLNALLVKLEATNYYPGLFENAYGTSDISLIKIQDAISQFIRSMVTFDSRLDRFRRGEGEHYLMITELEGLGLFQAKCEVCHLDGNQSVLKALEYPEAIEANPEFFANELEDEEDIGAGAWSPDLIGIFKVPTLRNIEKTAPYMHDGRFETLREAISHYSDGVEDPKWGMISKSGFQFTETEKSKLISFLLTMTDESFLTEVRWSDPFTQTVSNVELDEVLLSAEVFPNPSNGLTYINFENINQRQVMAYLMSMDGKIVRKLSTHKNGFVTDVSQLPAGMYMVRIQNGDSFLDKKLVVSP